MYLPPTYHLLTYLPASLPPTDTTGFNVFSADRSQIDVLEVEEGRQNCFAALLVFLLQSLRVAVQTAATVASTDGGGGRGGGRGSPVQQQSPSHLSPQQTTFGTVYRGDGYDEHAGDPPVS